MLDLTASNSQFNDIEAVRSSKMPGADKGEQFNANLFQTRHL